MKCKKLKSMASKLRRDLPYSVSEQWNKEHIKIFNEHRSSYKKMVKMVEEEIYGDMAFIVSPEAEKHEGRTRSIMMTFEQNKKNAMQLLQITLKKQVHDFSYTLPQIGLVEAITAFYLPKTVTYLCFTADNIILGEYCDSLGSFEEESLNDLLEESWSVPEQENRNDLEALLWESRKGHVPFVHKQEEMIVINGIEYYRFIFFQPFFPLISQMFTTYRFVSNIECTIYVEGVMLSCDVRNFLIDGPTIGWMECSNFDCPLYKYEYGKINPIRYYLKPGYFGRNNEYYRREDGTVSLARYLKSPYLGFNVEFSDLNLNDLNIAESDIAIPEPELGKDKADIYVLQ